MKHLRDPEFKPNPEEGLSPAAHQRMAAFRAHLKAVLAGAETESASAEQFQPGEQP